MFNNSDIPENQSEGKEFPILSPPGNYLSPASLDSRSSFTVSNFDTKNTSVNTPSPLSFINGAVQSLSSVYNQKIMSDTDGTYTNSSDVRASTRSATENTPGKGLQTNVTSTIKDRKGNIVKRKYSRNGCSECKRRRMKCDESKPQCWQCARLNRECVYISNPKNKRKKPTNSKKVSKETNEDMIRTTDSSASQLTPEEAVKLEHSVSQANVAEQSQASSSLEVPNLVPLSTIDGYDVNLLMQNLNDMVNMKLNDSFLLNENLKGFDLPDLDIPELLPSNPVSSVPISFLVNNVIQFNIQLASFKLGGIHDEYLKVFYYDCLDSIAPFFQDQGNPLRDILLSFARNESYLLSAILSVGASISHRKSNKLEDERNYCAYLSHCLSLLGEQFQNESNVVNKIEPIILTVILLAWDCIYTMNSQWRSHLKGVTDLFKKINAGKSSKVLNVAKCWFKVAETFASISTILGGSLVEDDLDLIFDPYDYQYVESLKFLNIMTPLNEFNLLRGHKEDFDLVIKEVIRALTSIRSAEKGAADGKNSGSFTRNLEYLQWSPQDNKNNKEPLSYFETQKILVEIDRQLEYEFIDKSGIIPRDSQSYPLNSQIEDNAIDLVTLRDGKIIAISWYDISHQTQVLSFLLIVLLKLLGIPKESITIQQVVKKIMSFFSFLNSDNPPKNSRTCYSNFAVLIAGLNAMDEDTRNIVRDYYKLNGGTSRRLTEHNLNRLERVWSGETDGENKLEDEDVLTW